MDIQIVVHLCNGLLLSHEKAQITDTFTNPEEFQKHYAKIKKPDIRDYVQYDSI